MANKPTFNDQQITDIKIIRRYRTADALADGRPLPIKFIIDGRDGSLVFPADREVFEADEVVLWLPAERFDALQTLVRVEPLTDAFDEGKDRYLAYHGEHDTPHWARCTPESLRSGARVWSGDDTPLINGLREAEPRMCKELNRDIDRLRRLCMDMVDVEPPTPLAVGVDDDGIDVRASIGILRLEFPRRARDSNDAEAMLRGLLDPGLDLGPSTR